MSSDNTVLAELPKFKDKVMYMTGSNSDTRLEKSYQISASFKGIVRLSPNNHTIYSEKSTHQLSQADEKAEGLIYSDAIKFENDVQTAIKSNCDITKRMIIASESSGYFVNFRISDRDVEFDNLGIIGMAETEHLVLFSRELNFNNAFRLNGKRMPTLSSTNGLGSITIDKTYDFKQVNINGTGDYSEILYKNPTSDGVDYHYKKTQRFISDIVKEALLSLQTIPTGSIHYVPVTLEQYKELCGNLTPNKNIPYDDNGNPLADPLVRDFLLCDGRSYRNIDFPELAKVLNRQKLFIWEKSKYNNGFLNQKQVFNNYQDENYQSKDGELIVKTFRVPDLRHMFIGAVPAYGQDSMKTQTINNVSNIDTGNYFPDNLPVYTQRYKPDDHRHFIAYGSYDFTFYSLNKTFNTSQINGYITHHPKVHRRFNTVSGVVGCLYLANHPFHQADTYSNGFSYRQTKSGDYEHKGCDSIPGHYWLSLPLHNINTTKKDNFTKHAFATTPQIMCGKSSIQIPSYNSAAPSNTSLPDALYGHENAPKFIAMLPLIKI